MKLGALVLMGGTLVLAGCATSASGHDPQTTSRPTSAPSTAPTASSSQATLAPTSSVPVKVKHTGNPYTDAMADLNARNFATSENEFRAAIKAKNNVPASYAGLGTAYVEQYKYPIAYQAFKNAATLEPKDPGYLYNTAYTALMSQDFHNAVNYATMFLRLEPNNVAGYHVRLLAYGSLLKAKDQLHDAQKIVALAPHSASAYNDLGIAYGNSRRYADAAKAFSHAIQIDPTTVSYFTNRAVAETLDKQLPLALADFQHARSLAKDPGTRKQLDLQIAQLKKHIQP